MPTEVKTIVQEREAIANLFKDMSDLAALYDYEPRHVAKTPAVTVQFVGITPEPANLRQIKQLRLYEVRLYLALEDTKQAQDKFDTLFTKVWDTLVQAITLGDKSNVIFTRVGESSIDVVVDQNKRAFVVGMIRLQSEHRTSYC